MVDSFHEERLDKPVFGVINVTKKDLEALKGGASEANLGGDMNLTAKITELGVNGLLDSLKQTSEEAVVLNWEGTKIPRGASIDGKEIGWTQNGVVTSVDGKMLGTYDRLMEWGGENGKQHCMVVYKMGSSK